jgi:hypothetical protein
MRVQTGCALVAVAAALLTGFAASANASAPADCHVRDNSSEAKLLACMDRDALWQHLERFQKIADENPGGQGHGNRNTGTSGYRASVAYVARLMRHAGYRVTVQRYAWERFAVLGRPVFRIDGHATEREWPVARLSGSGSVSAEVRALRTGHETGCAPADFRGFARGRIALLQRGSCDFDAQVANAQAAGAAAVVLYNAAPAPRTTSGRSHNDGRAIVAQITTPAAIPVIGMLSYATGAELAARSATGHAAHVAIDVRTRRKSDIDYNLIADSPYGDANHVVVVDAHLDAIHGAGILDNASGSVSILELALNLAHTPTRNRLRYIWFGGEELGLLGSHFYTRTLPPKELRKLVFDIDADVTATPNFDVLVADPGHAVNADKFPPNVVAQSQLGNRVFTRYFRSAGIASRLANFGNDGTDSNAFSLAGVPNTGILTQQDCCKKTWEVAIWGGYLGNYEGKVPGRDGGCVDWPGRWCDNLSNNDPFVLTFVSKGIASVVLTLSNHRFR